MYVRRVRARPSNGRSTRRRHSWDGSSRLSRRSSTIPNENTSGNTKRPAVRWLGVLCNQERLAAARRPVVSGDELPLRSNNNKRRQDWQDGRDNGKMSKALLLSRPSCQSCLRLLLLLSLEVVWWRSATEHRERGRRTIGAISEKLCSSEHSVIPLRTVTVSPTGM